MPLPEEVPPSLTKWLIQRKRRGEKQLPPIQEENSANEGERTPQKGNTRKLAQNIRNVNVAGNLFSGPRFLLDERIAARILREKTQIVSITPSTQKHGKGTFGYVTSAEVRMRSAGREFMNIAAFKVSHEPMRLEEGVAPDTLKEMSIYARAAHVPGLAKGLFAKLDPNDQRLIMEHYIMNLHELFKNKSEYTPEYYATLAPENRPTTLSGQPKFDVIRGVLFQLAIALKGMHDMGAIHHDLKPANMLLAHDGRITITDYGLSEYCVTGIKQPAGYYYRDTTPMIQPPESLSRIALIGPAYDIFSLGASFVFFMTRYYYFNFYANENNANSARRDWRTFTRKDDYIGVLADILQDIRGYGKEINDLVKGMLAIDPSKRMTVDEVLASDWLKGMTMSSAARAVRKGLFKEGQPYGERTTRLLRNTRRKENIGASNNATVGEYFAIRPLPLITRMASGSAIHRVRRMNLLTGVAMNEKIPIYTLFHSLELCDRLLQVRKAHNAAKEITDSEALLCLLIAGQLHPFYVNYFPEVVIMKMAFETEKAEKGRATFEGCVKMEVGIITELCGDMYPQKGGLVDVAVRALNAAETKGLGARECMAASLLLNYAILPGLTLEKWKENGIEDLEKIDKEVTEQEQTIFESSIPLNEALLWALLKLRRKKLDLSKVKEDDEVEEELGDILRRKFSKIITFIPKPD